MRCTVTVSRHAVGVDLCGCCCMHVGAGNKRLQATGDELSGQKALFKDTHKHQRTIHQQSWMDRCVSLCVGWLWVVWQHSTRCMHHGCVGQQTRLDDNTGIHVVMRCAVVRCALVCCV